MKRTTIKTDTDGDVEMLKWCYWYVKSDKTSCSVHFPTASAQR